MDAPCVSSMADMFDEEDVGKVAAADEMDRGDNKDASCSGLCRAGDEREVDWLFPEV